MKVVVKVISGSNSGKEYDLTSPPKENHCYVLCEDDVLEFKLSLESESPYIHLALHEIYIPPNDFREPTEDEPYFQYYWKPKIIGSGNFLKEAFFHNFCGLAELLITNHVEQVDGSFENEILYSLYPIEILAKKINAIRISSMLDFLARDDGEDLIALARVTRRKSGFQEGNRTIAVTLDRIEKYLKILEDSLPKILQKPITKIVSKNKIRQYTQNSTLTEDSINYLIDSPDTVYQVLHFEESLFSLPTDDLTNEFSYFSTDRILEQEINYETNIYENQVLFGFLETLLIAIAQIHQKLNEIKPSKNETYIQGYESLFNNLNKFTVKLNFPHIKRCTELTNSLKKIRAHLNKKIKISVPYLKEPYFTHKAKQNPFYQKIFSMMIEWLRFGTPDWSLQNELSSINSLAKLFEFYVFCVVKTHISNYIDYSSDGLMSSKGNDFGHGFSFKLNKTTRIELFYEPIIFHEQGLSRMDLPEYINTEAWKEGMDKKRKLSQEYSIYSSIRQKDGFKLRVDSPKVNYSKRIKRIPDIVIRLRNDDKEAILIIDAKYMNTRKAFYNALPDCTMKYLHGIHEVGTGKSNSIGLMIVNPDEDDITIHYHHNQYSIYGEKTIIPAMLTSAINVSIAHKESSQIQKNIFRFMNMMSSAIS